MLLPAWQQHTLTSITHLQVVTLRKFSTHVEIRKILPECWRIFFPLHFISNFRNILGKLSFRDRWEDLAGCLCYWWGHVCKLQHNHFYPYYSAYISVTISVSVRILITELCVNVTKNFCYFLYDIVNEFYHCFV